MDAYILWRLQLEQVLVELAEQAPPEPHTFFVVGCSTSEVAGKRIGTSGAMDVAKALYGPLLQFAEKHQLHLAFQGCEHINRAITMERASANAFGLDPVSVVPVRTAGGAMSAYAYEQFKDPVVVETVRANAGIDIGQTLIGMQLKPVAVPIRTSVKQVGEAIVTCATTRPKLIGGTRAQYK